jgi:hypothetical protein
MIIFAGGFCQPIGCLMGRGADYAAGFLLQLTNRFFDKSPEAQLGSPVMIGERL